MDEDAVLLDESLSSELQEEVSSTEPESMRTPGSNHTSPISHSSASFYSTSPTHRLSPYTHTGGTQPVLTADGRSVASSPKYQTELLLAKSKITYLETELLSLRRAAKRARIEEEVRESDKTKFTSLNAERAHMLEQERRRLLEDLLTQRDKLEHYETELNRCQGQQALTLSTHSKEVQSLKSQLEEAGLTINSLELKNKHLNERVQVLEENAELNVAHLHDLENVYENSLQSFRSRVYDMEKKESQFIRLEHRIQELEQILKEQEEDAKCLEAMKSQLIHCEDIERENQQLKTENRHLREKNNNIELLRYQLQCFREKCTKLEGYEQQLVDCQLTNKELEAKIKQLTEGGSEGAANGGSMPLPSAALQYRIADLQQRELISLTKQAELEAKVRSLEQSLGESVTTAQELKQQLLKEKEEVQIRDEKIQRLERRLLFVSKERDGCVNVLKSYQLDKSVDRLLKEQLKEMEQQLSRANERIKELEAEHESKEEQECQQRVDEGPQEKQPLIIC